jgi:hypothetical protein
MFIYLSTLYSLSLSFPHHMAKRTLDAPCTLFVDSPATGRQNIVIVDSSKHLTVPPSLLYIGSSSTSCQFSPKTRANSQTQTLPIRVLYTSPASNHALVLVCLQSSSASPVEIPRDAILHCLRVCA